MRSAEAVVLVFVLAACRTEKVDAQGKAVEVGRLRLHTFPPGARVWIDGELKVEATPATLILKEGKYQLRIQAPGADAIEKQIEIEAGDVREMSLNIPKPPDARISVFSDVVGADVRINGYRRGATPLESAVTRPGPVDITVTTPNGRAKSAKIDLGIGEQRRVEVLFGDVASKPEPPSTPANQSRPVPRGYLTLGLNPDGEVFDDEGKKLGETPLVKKVMDPGQYDLLLRSHDGRYEKHVSIEIEPDQAAVFRFHFRDEDQVPGWKPPQRDAGPSER